MKELYTFAIGGTIPELGKSGSVELHLSLEETEVEVFKCITNIHNHEAIKEIALALRGRFPITMPGHFKRDNYKKEIEWPEHLQKKEK